MKCKYFNQENEFSNTSISIKMNDMKRIPRRILCRLQNRGICEHNLLVKHLVASLSTSDHIYQGVYAVAFLSSLMVQVIYSGGYPDQAD